MSASRSGDPNVSGISDPNQSAIKRFLIGELLQGQQEAVIVHNGEDYRLRITSNGKLILTK